MCAHWAERSQYLLRTPTLWEKEYPDGDAVLGPHGATHQRPTLGSSSPRCGQGSIERLSQGHGPPSNVTSLFYGGGSGGVVVDDIDGNLRPWQKFWDLIIELTFATDQHLFPLG